MKKLFIITGTSRGIGEAIAESLTEEKNHVIGLSRTENKPLKDKFGQAGATFDFWPIDLSDVEGAEAAFEEHLRKLTAEQYESVTLINNAGLLEPIDQIANTKAADVVKHMNVNLTSLMVITASFVRHFKNHPKKEIISISSGAAYNPYTGWGSYCASKAGSLMFSKVLAEEQKSVKHPAKVVSLAPGVVETDMQRTIRSKNKVQFPNIDKFIELKEKGILSSAKQVGKTIAGAILDNPRIKNGEEIDLRTFQDG